MSSSQQVNDRVMIAIKDEGPGMSENALNKISELFLQQNKKAWKPLKNPLKVSRGSGNGL